LKIIRLKFRPFPKYKLKHDDKAEIKVSDYTISDLKKETEFLKCEKFFKHTSNSEKIEQHFDDKKQLTNDQYFFFTLNISATVPTSSLSPHDTYFCCQLRGHVRLRSMVDWV